MEEFDPAEFIEDGLPALSITHHSVEKYKLVNFYALIFARAMRAKWQNLCYMDLFCGPGAAQIRNTGKFIEAPPLTLMKQEVKFDRYIFCDIDERQTATLKARTKRFAASTCAYFHVGDSNKIVDNLAADLPRFSSSNRGLTLCYLDPFRLSNLNFRTIRALSRFRIDFLVLIPTGMDAHRNLRSIYSQPDNHILDNFLGHRDWRARWNKEKHTAEPRQFVLNEFVKNMVDLGYRRPSPESIKEIRLFDKNALLYHLALFSKSYIANKFWTAGMKSTDPQNRLFD